MNVIVHPTHGMNIDIQLSTNACNVGPQFWPKFAVYRFVSAFRAEHHMHDVLCVGMRHVPHLRCSAFLYTTHPALTRWAKVCRASGAWSAQRRRAWHAPCARLGLTRYSQPCRWLVFKRSVTHFVREDHESMKPPSNVKTPA